jgi:hypothetical protein
VLVKKVTFAAIMATAFLLSYTINTAYATAIVSGVYNSHNNLNIPMEMALPVQLTGNNTIVDRDTEEGFLGSPDTTSDIQRETRQTELDRFLLGQREEAGETFPKQLEEMEIEEEVEANVDEVLRGIAEAHSEALVLVRIYLVLNTSITLQNQTALLPLLNQSTLSLLDSLRNLNSFEQQFLESITRTNQTAPHSTIPPA